MLANGRFVDDTTFAASMEPRSIGSDQALKTSPASDDLDGDRPWEIMTSALYVLQILHYSLCWREGMFLYA